MDSDDIRDQIDEAFQHEEETEELARRLSRSGAPRAQRADCLSFIKAYIRETPDVMDATYHAASQAGALESVRAVFDTAFQYWAEEYDIIPDSQGLIGLTDDAYLTRLFMETVSGFHAASAGRPLLSVDLGPTNRVMRGLIGEPLASQLDAVVAQTVAGQMMQSGLQQLAGLGFLDLGMSGFESRLEQYEMDQRIDTQLGAMGIF